MLKKLFGKGKKEPVEMPEADGKDILTAYANGEVVALSEVPDPTFSEKMMGDGIAIKPSEGAIYAPVHAEVVQMSDSMKHAVGLKTVNGVEILIHIGLETVAMKGEGFKQLVKEGEKVAKGEKLIEFDLDLVNEKAESTITPMVITNADDTVASMEKHEGMQGIAGETVVLEITAK